jgi:hypothetical protein
MMCHTSPSALHCSITAPQRLQQRITLLVMRHHYLPTTLAWPHMAPHGPPSPSPPHTHAAPPLLQGFTEKFDRLTVWTVITMLGFGIQMLVTSLRTFGGEAVIFLQR